MNVSNNSRFKETEKTLKETLLNMILTDNQIESITVSELSKASGISRKTFYCHHSFPSEILDEIEKETLRDVTIYMSNINGNEDKKTLSLIKYIKEKQNVFKVLLNISNRSFVNQLMKLSFPTFNEIEFHSKQKNIFQYVKSYTLTGTETIIRDWIHNDCKEEDSTIARLIVQLAKEAIDLSFRFKNVS